MNNLYGCRQKENENLQEYTKRFRSCKEVYESLWGKTDISKQVEKDPDFSEYMTRDERQVISDRIWEEFCAILYVKNSDQAKYGTLWKGLNTQNSLENNQYPKMIKAATKVLNTHIFDNIGTKKPKSDKHQKEKEENKDEEELELSFAHMDN